jgi:[ribosomal protein S5]-alanine N-acetyltransferase
LAVLPEFRAYGESAHELVTPEYGMFWATLNAHRGKGYAAEAARAFMNDFIFGVLNARRAIATTEHDNIGSQRVMEKIGMTLYRNPGPDPFWFNVVGVAYHPSLAGTSHTP